MKANGLKISERVKLGCIGLAGAVLFLSAPTLIAWWLDLFV